MKTYLIFLISYAIFAYSVGLVLIIYILNSIKNDEKEMETFRNQIWLYGLFLGFAPITLISGGIVMLYNYMKVKL